MRAWRDDGGGPGLIAALVVAAGIVAIGVVDHTGTVSAMRGVSTLQAAALREAVAAAARNSHASARAAEEELGRRLLDNARLLKRLDGRNRLTEPVLQQVVDSNNLFRLALYDEDGQPLMSAGRPQGFGGGARLAMQCETPGKKKLSRLHTHHDLEICGWRLASGSRVTGTSC